DTGAILPTVAFPGVVAWFPRLRNGMKLPYQLAGAHVPRPYVPARSAARALRYFGAGDHQIAIDGRRRGHRINRVGKSIRDSGAQIHLALFSEAGNGLAGFGIQRDQPAVQRTKQDSRRRALVAWPVRHAAM